MCQGSDSDIINGSIGLAANTYSEIKMMGDNNNNNNNNNNFFSSYGGASPHCSCMNGSRRVRKRHPATVQTPGRLQEMVESPLEVMEPLVTGSWSQERLGERGWGQDRLSRGDSSHRQRDFNDNLRCDDKPGNFETQFVMEFSHLKMSSQRHGSFDDCATSDLNCQLLSSSRNLK